jgi:conjugal transfer pilus assembly protein TraB
MANWKINTRIKSVQIRTLIGVVSILILIVAVVIGFLAEGRPKKNAAPTKLMDLTGIVEESFTDAVADNALASQQSDLESLKKTNQRTHSKYQSNGQRA